MSILHKMGQVEELYNCTIALTSGGHHVAHEKELVEGDSTMLVARPFRPFKTSEEYLYAMREDLAEWLSRLYVNIGINVDNFFQVLETGEILCQHANNVRRKAADQKQRLEEQAGVANLLPESPRNRKWSTKWEVPSYEVVFRCEAPAGSFFARDNVHNFIRWCRDLGVHEVLLFETDDLVMRKNEKHVILSLLEVARRGARFGIEIPILVQMENDIERELEADRRAEERQAALHNGEDAADEMEDEMPEVPILFYGPQQQIITNDLKSLDEMVRELVERCTCPSQFPMIKVSEGKYRVGDTKVLIFVRILRNHVMVRVGGGWDTLHHYLDKHDPCRCRAGHRMTISSKVGFKVSVGGERQMTNLMYERCEEGSPFPRRKFSGFVSCRRESAEDRAPPTSHRSQSPSTREYSYGSLGRYSASKSVPVPELPIAHDDLVNKSPEPLASCDSSSEVSDEGYKSQGPLRTPERQKKTSKKVNSIETLEPHERPESSMTQASSEGSTVSTDDLGIPPTPPRSPTTTTSEAQNSTITWTSSATETPINARPKSRIPFLESLNTKYLGHKRSKQSPDGDKKSITWNSSPTSKANRIANVSENIFPGHSISRSHSTTSEGGFHNLIRDCSVRNSLRSPKRSAGFAMMSGKNTWNGRTSRERPSLGVDTYKPPTPVRGVRSASASPAPVRRTFNSTPNTPIMRSPKRSAPPSGVISPWDPHPKVLAPNLPDLNAEPNIEILAHLEEIVNSYRAKIVDKYAAEGKSIPPELIEDEPNSWARTKPSPVVVNDTSNLPGKPTPRKKESGSRIPAPIFFS